MPRTMSLLSISATMLAFCVWAGGAQAQATRTWVSGVGDDANPCSRTAPCKTFAGAISKTACGGEIDALDPGGFGAVTITKPITIDGGGGQVAGILAAGTFGVTINFPTSPPPSCTGPVILRNLTINGAITGLIGIRIFNASDVHVEHCDIYEFNSGTGDGILVNTVNVANISLFVNNTFLQHNINGIRIAP